MPKLKEIQDLVVQLSKISTYSMIQPNVKPAILFGQALQVLINPEELQNALKFQISLPLIQDKDILDVLMNLQSQQL